MVRASPSRPGSASRPTPRPWPTSSAGQRAGAADRCPATGSRDSGEPARTAIETTVSRSRRRSSGPRRQSSGNRTGESPKSSRARLLPRRAAPPRPPPRPAPSARAPPPRRAGRTPAAAAVRQLRRAAPASSVSAHSAAVAWITKLRVNRPRARACSPDIGCPPAGGQVRPSHDRTSPPPSPVRAARSTYSQATGNRACSAASAGTAAPPVCPYMAPSIATLALARSPPNASAASAA